MSQLSQLILEDEPAMPEGTVQLAPHVVLFPDKPPLDVFRNQLCAYTDLDKKGEVNYECGLPQRETIIYGPLGPALRRKYEDDNKRPNLMLSMSASGWHWAFMDLDSVEQAIALPSNVDLILGETRKHLWAGDGDITWQLWRSSTWDHFHAYCNMAFRWDEYRLLLEECVSRYACDPVWARISMERGYGAFRLPTVLKTPESVDDESPSKIEKEFWVQ